MIRDESLRHSAPFVVGSLAAIGWTFSGLLSTDTLPAYRDLLFFVVPMKYFLGESLRHGQIPLWNPYIYMGTPFLAGLQSGVFYPPSLLLVVPFPLGFNLFLLAHYLIALGGMWAWLRYRGLSAPATAIGSLTFVIGGYLVSMLNVTNHLQGAVWAPWIVLAWARYCDTRELGRLLVLTLLLAVQLLAGSPETQLMTLTVLGAWTAYGFFPRFGHTLRLGLTLAAALLLVVAVTAFQILPTLEYLRESARSGALSRIEVMTWSLEPVSLLQLLLPNSASLLPASDAYGPGQGFEKIYPWISSIYLGLISLCLAIVGAVYGRERRLWSGLILAAVLLALGKHTPILPWLYDWVPIPFGRFRYPEKFYFVIQLAVAVLAAEGGERLLRSDRGATRTALTAAATFLAIATAIVVMRWIQPMHYLWLVSVLRAEAPDSTWLVPLSRDVIVKCYRLVLILGAFAGVLLLQRQAALRPLIFSFILVALVAADLSSTSQNLNFTISWSDLNASPPLLDVSRLRQDHRRTFHYQTVSAPYPGMDAKPIDGLEEWSNGPTANTPHLAYYRALWPALYAGRVMMVHVEAIPGADGIQRRSDNFLRYGLSLLPQRLAVNVLRIFSCGYLLGGDPLQVDELEAVPQSVPSGIFAYHIPDSLPVAYLASRLRLASDERQTLNALNSKNFVSGTDAVVYELPSGWEDSKVPSQGGTAEISIRDPEHVQIQVRTHDRALLVLNDSYFPGWEARVDGALAQIHRTNSMVRGVVVGPNDRIVDFRYRPASWRIGTRMSATALAVFVALVVVAVRGRQSP